MQRFCFRFTIGRIMILIAVLALALAVLPGWLQIVGSIWLVGVIGLVVVLMVVADIPWVQATGWVFASYPLGCLGSIYATWLAAWVYLDRRPISLRVDPASLGGLVPLCHVLSWVYLYGCYPSVMLCGIFLIAEARRPKNPEQPGRAGTLAVVALGCWVGTYIVAAIDPIRVGDWWAY